MELELLWLLAADLPLNNHVNLIWSSITLGHKMSLPMVVHLTKGQPDTKVQEAHIWSQDVSAWGSNIWPVIKLTEVVNTFGHKLSLGSMSPQDVSGRYVFPVVNLTEVVTHLATRCPVGVCLTRGQPDWSRNTLGHKVSLSGVHLMKRSACPKDLTKMSTWPEASPTGGYIWPRVSLTWRSDKNVNLTWSHLWGYIWLSAKRTSENINILCILGLASQRSFL